VAEENLSRLSTEGRDPALAELDQLPTAEVVRAVVHGHQEVLAAVAAVQDAVARLAESVAERMNRGGRVIYAGAGTGGRVALLDAAEWGPTFNVPEDAVIARVAGAEHPPGSAEEAAAEDDAAAGAAAVRALSRAPHTPLGAEPEGRGPEGARKVGLERPGPDGPEGPGPEGSLGVGSEGPGPEGSLGVGSEGPGPEESLGVGPEGPDSEGSRGVGPDDVVIGVLRQRPHSVRPRRDRGRGRRGRAHRRDHLPPRIRAGLGGRRRHRGSRRA
jgi:hypothetical protein